MHLYSMFYPFFKYLSYDNPTIRVSELLKLVVFFFVIQKILHLKWLPIIVGQQYLLKLGLTPKHNGWFVFAWIRLNCDLLH